MRCRLAPRSMTFDDLGLLQVQIFSEFCAISQIWEATINGKTKEGGPALSATELLRTESTFQRRIDDVDVAWRSSAKSTLVSCVLYTKAVARLPLR